MKRYYVYMLECSDGSFYVGVTNDLELRVAQHRHGADPSCYTFKRRPLLLVWSQDFKEIDEAIRSEKQIKSWRREKKVALIAGDWELMRALSRGMHPSTVRQAHGRLSSG